MAYIYSFKDFKENMSRAVGLDLPISRKQAIEVSNFIRGKSIDKARKILNNTIEMKKAIPFKRFTDGVGHKKGEIASGRYPINCCKAMLKLIEQAAANAQFKGLSTNLDIIHLSVQKAASQHKYGRKYGRTRKAAHVEVVLEEKAGVKAKVEKPSAKKVEEVKGEAQPKVEAKKEEPKPEVKPKVEAKKEEVKEAPKVQEKKAEVKKVEEKPAKTEIKNEVKEVREKTKTKTEKPKDDVKKEVQEAKE